MPQRIFSFLVAFVFIINGEVFSQIKMGAKPHFSSPSVLYYNDLIVKKKKYTVLMRGIEKIPNKKNRLPVFAAFSGEKNASDQLFYPSSAAALSSTFFCRNERLLQRSTGVALRLRLGSLAYVDWLEQKPNALPTTR